MTTIKVSAIDTATAMDQILSQLGADAMILETTTRDGKVEISATNDPDITLKKPNQISDVFTQIMKEEMNSPHANQRPYAHPMEPKPTLGPILDKEAAAKFMEYWINLPHSMIRQRLKSASICSDSNGKTNALPKRCKATKPKAEIILKAPKCFMKKR